jgi:hypothetical protein
MKLKLSESEEGNICGNIDKIRRSRGSFKNRILHRLAEKAEGNARLR